MTLGVKTQSIFPLKRNLFDFEIFKGLIAYLLNYNDKLNPKIFLSYLREFLIFGIK